MQQPFRLSVRAWSRPGVRLLSGPYGNTAYYGRVESRESEASATVQRGSQPVVQETNQTHHSNNEVTQRTVLTDLQRAVLEATPLIAACSELFWKLRHLLQLAASCSGSYAAYCSLQRAVLEATPLIAARSELFWKLRR